MKKILAILTALITGGLGVAQSAEGAMALN
jgi:hypothetical protein